MLFGAELSSRKQSTNDMTADDYLFHWAPLQFPSSVQLVPSLSTSVSYLHSSPTIESGCKVDKWN